MRSLSATGKAVTRGVGRSVSELRQIVVDRRGNSSLAQVVVAHVDAARVRRRTSEECLPRVQSRLSLICHCVTLRPCGYVLSLPPMVVKVQRCCSAISTMGNVCCTWRKLFGSKMLEYQLAPGLNWFTRLA